MLYHLLLWILAALAPEPAAVSRLAAPRFRDREAASRELARELSWPVAVRLALRPPRDPEVRVRVERALRGYWSATWPADRRLPYIDALNAVNLCMRPNLPLVDRYLAPHAMNSWGDFQIYRDATGDLVADLKAALVPPRVIRWLLVEMERRSDLWDALGRPRDMPVGRAAGWRRMPQPPR